ncbi:flagellar FliJ family protein [Helicobacter sp. 23-1046]
MRTPYSPLVDMRKTALTNHEHKMMQNTFAINQTQGQIDALNAEIAMIRFPESGEYSAYKAISYTKNTLLLELDSLLGELANLKAQTKVLQEEYRVLNIEYEKMQYLETREMERKMKKQKKSQQRANDEMSILLYSKKGGIL